VEQKETTLVAALRKATDFIRATEICADSLDAPKKAKALGDKNFNRSDRNPDPWERGRSLRQLTSGLPPTLGASSIRLKGILCCGDRLL